MALTFRLEGERGARYAEVVDYQGDLSRLIVRWTDPLSICLRFIDPYGHTIFNRLQMEQFISELTAIRVLLEHPLAQQTLDQVLALCLECQTRPHRYIVMYGD
jgi:hypothetical protein